MSPRHACETSVDTCVLGSSSFFSPLLLCLLNFAQFCSFLLVLLICWQVLQVPLTRQEEQLHALHRLQHVFTVAFCVPHVPHDRSGGAFVVVLVAIGWRGLRAKPSGPTRSDTARRAGDSGGVLLMSGTESCFTFLSCPALGLLSASSRRRTASRVARVSTC
jgi:hypothetical protein